ncbi:DUF4276 family protein [Maridesulfovibrio sp.]|uniref:DUF4276 family protein n=1 Tax=Maridesulfovibrio sp. TaxID=2795000 RepID=UPI002A18BB75|nr:DUF4276 family protein [Maridesulfovibrio sp.]
MSTIMVFVEGGALRNKQLNIDCRRAFKVFFKKYGIADNKIKVIACGSRQFAYRDFCIEISQAKEPKHIILLVDSEKHVEKKHRYKPWDHFKEREGDKHWQKPTQADDNSAQLMVQCMEAWFMADKTALKEYYKKNFKVTVLPTSQDIENIDKKILYSSLEKATKDTQKGKYSKGNHSFKILAEINPVNVKDKSSWAERLLEHLKELCP